MPPPIELTSATPYVGTTKPPSTRSEKYLDEKAAYTVEVGSVAALEPHTDAVFGEIGDGGPNYRGVGWKGACVLMVKANVGLGVLSLPVVMHTLGMVPGIIIIITVQVIVTCKWGEGRREGGADDKGPTTRLASSN